MWRWVTRCLVFASLAFLTPAVFAQQFIGDVDYPDSSRTQSGVVYVRGWALDPTGVSKIELWVDDTYQQDMINNLPRLDIIEAYPDYPGIHSSRPGFVTGFLASRFENGPHTVEVRVITSNGDVHFLGRRTININNSINQAPFGSLDIPGGDGVYNVAGAFPVNGWAADTDGIDRIEVIADGGVLQGAIYGDPRPDVGATFPDFPAAMYSGWVANIDSTRLQNGVHTLTVRAIDRNGLSTVIGHRMVQVINNDLFLKPFGFLDEPQRDAVLYGTGCDDDGDIIVSPPIRPHQHITPIRGWALDLGTREDVGGVAYAELLIDGARWLSTDDCRTVDSSFANCYGLPRFDVGRYYPTFPDAPRAGFLFTLDVGALIKLGVRPGGHHMKIRVGDREQTFAEIPNKDGIPVWFQCVNRDFDFTGFGFIEFPNSFDYVGGDVLFRGWALEDQETIATVEIYVDGSFMGLAQYGYPRPDVADQYPQITDSVHSGWAFLMDTRKLANSRHRLTVRTTSSNGHGSEIGSVDFYVFNNNPQQ